MIIKFDKKIEDIERVNRARVEQLFSELARASRLGHHFVIISRDLCVWAREKCNFTEMDRASNKKIEEQYSQKCGVSKIKNAIVIEICLDDSSITRINRVNYRVGIDFILGSRILEPGILMVENDSSDGQMMDLIFNSMRKRMYVTNISYRLQNGGGSTILGSLQNNFDGKEILVCVLDSDKKTPFESESTAAKNIVKLMSKRNFVGMVKVFPFREIENLIPLRIIVDNKLAKNYKEFGKIIKLHNTQGDANQLDCFWLYFDLKNGVLFQDVNKCKSSESKEWYVRKFFPDADNKKIEGFGENIINAFLTTNKAKSDFAKFTEEKYWDLHFSEIFHELYSYFLADKRMASN